MSNKKKKIAYVSGTRADFGLMTPILRAIDKSKKLDLQVYATGVHLMPEFGKTINHVRKEFSSVASITATFDSDNRIGMVKFMGEFSKRLGEILNKNRPDVMLTLGDRPEMLATASVCLYLGIPTAHIGGGDKTTTVDEVARHAITKLSHLHFPATKESAERIRRMGEDDHRIHIVGTPALDVILNGKLQKREVLFKKLGLDSKKPLILVTQHPVSEEYEDAKKQMIETLSAVESFHLPTVVIYPHADAGGRKIIAEINRERDNPDFHIFPSLPHKDFLALEREAVVWVGNSSAIMLESASFQTPVVNIGSRQSGRQHGENVLDVGYNRNQIRLAIKKSLEDKNYLNKLKKVTNPWGDGKTGPRVAKILENLHIDNDLLKKRIAY